MSRRRATGSGAKTGLAAALLLAGLWAGVAGAAVEPPPPDPQAAGVPAGPATGEAQPPLPLSLAEALTRARAASPRLGELVAGVAAGQADLAGAEAESRPRLDLSASYTRLSDVPELSLPLPGGGSRVIFPNLPDNYASRLGASLPLYTGGRVAAGIDVARQRLAAAGQGAAAGRADLDLETETAYWNLVLARRRQQVVSEAQATYEAHLADAQNRGRFGFAAANEVLAVEVERDRAQLAALQAANGAAVAEAGLAQLLGLPHGASIEPTDSPETTTAASDAATPPAQTGSAVPLEAEVADALAHRPERAAAAAALAAARAAVTAAAGASRPQLSAGAGYDWANPNRRILPPSARFDDSWDVSLRLSLDLFDGGRTAAAVARARADADAARFRLEEVERAIRLEVESRALDLSSAAAAVAVAHHALASARENLRVVSDRYREGLVPSSERLDAETALLGAGLDATQVEVAVRLARARLERALGR